MNNFVNYSTILTITNINSTFKKEESIYKLELMASSFFINGGDYDLINFNNVDHKLIRFDINNLSGYIVTTNKDAHTTKLYTSTLKPISYEKFFNDIENLVEDNIIILFEFIPYRYILLMFKFKNIVINGGTNTKKHILSPIQLKLSRYLFILLGPEGSQLVDKSIHMSQFKGYRPKFNKRELKVINYNGFKSVKKDFETLFLIDFKSVNWSFQEWSIVFISLAMDHYKHHFFFLEKNIIYMYTMENESLECSEICKNFIAIIREMDKSLLSFESWIDTWLNNLKAEIKNLE